MDKDFLYILKSLLNNDPSKEISDIHKLNSFLDKDFFDAVSVNAPPDFSNIFYNLKNELEKFYNLIVFPKMQNKSIVTFGGSFSSGKSSLINSLTARKLLPYDINPTTAVPTYISQDDNSKAYAVNIFNNIFNIHIKNLKFISHEMETLEESPFHFSQLIKNIYIEVPYFPFNNLIFLDTPGYSKSEVSNFHQSDEDISKYYYNSSDNLIWLVSSDIGTLTEEDINILSKINKNTKLLIILSKVDKLSEKNIGKIIAQIKVTLDDAKIDFEDILTFSKRTPRDYDFDSIYKYFKAINDTTLNTNFLKNFYYYFNIIETYYNNSIANESRRLFRLNNALTFIDDKVAEQNILVLADEVKDNINDFTNTRSNFRKHKTSFLFELKKIALANNMDVTEEDFHLFVDKILFNINDYKKNYYNINDFEIEKLVSRYSDKPIINGISDKIQKETEDISSVIKNNLENVQLIKNSLSIMNINYDTMVLSEFRKIFEGNV